MKNDFIIIYISRIVPKYLIYKKNFNGFVPISHIQGFMGVCGNKGLPQKMENIKLNEKLRLGRQSSLPRQS